MLAAIQDEQARPVRQQRADLAARPSDSVGVADRSRDMGRNVVRIAQRTQVDSDDRSRLGLFSGVRDVLPHEPCFAHSTRPGDRQQARLGQCAGQPAQLVLAANEACGEGVSLDERDLGGAACRETCRDVDL